MGIRLLYSLFNLIRAWSYSLGCKSILGRKYRLVIHLFSQLSVVNARKSNVGHGTIPSCILMRRTRLGLAWPGLKLWPASFCLWKKFAFWNPRERHVLIIHLFIFAGTSLAVFAFLEFGGVVLSWVSILVLLLCLGLFYFLFIVFLFVSSILLHYDAVMS
jgi:hypothetical protein